MEIVLSGVFERAPHYSGVTAWDFHPTSLFTEPIDQLSLLWFGTYFCRYSIVFFYVVFM